jgi:hypothetical protein
MVTIGTCRFDRDSGLVVRPDGGESRLGRQLNGLICLLMDAPGNRLSSTEIRQAIWPGKKDRNNNLHNAMGRLRTIFGEDALPRVSEEGVYRLAVKSPGTGETSFTAENILGSIVLGPGSAPDAYSAPQVMLYGREMLETLRAKSLWNRIVQGLVHHVYVARGRGMNALCVNLVARLYAASDVREGWSEWDRAVSNLRFRFLSRLQPPGDSIVVEAPGAGAGAFVRHGEKEFGQIKQSGTALEYWWTLDETFDDHRWRIAWAETPLDAGLLADQLEQLFHNQPGLPARAWEGIVRALRSQRKGPQKEQPGSQTHSNIVS